MGFGKKTRGSTGQAKKPKMIPRLIIKSPYKSITSLRKYLNK
jgi:hypothetical protein